MPFNKCAWHCGPSLWNGIKGLNSRAIGIELVNAGNLERDGLGQWVKRGRIIPNDDVVVRVGGEPPTAFLDKIGVQRVVKELAIGGGSAAAR